MPSTDVDSDSSPKTLAEHLDLITTLLKARASALSVRQKEAAVDLARKNLLKNQSLYLPSKNWLAAAAAHKDLKKISDECIVNLFSFLTIGASESEMPALKLLFDTALAKYLNKESDGGGVTPPKGIVGSSGGGRGANQGHQPPPPVQRQRGG